MEHSNQGLTHFRSIKSSGGHKEKSGLMYHCVAKLSHSQGALMQKRSISILFKRQDERESPSQDETSCSSTL